MSNQLRRLQIEESLTRLPVCERRKIERAISGKMPIGIHLLSSVSASIAKDIVFERKRDPDYLKNDTFF